MSNAVPPIFAEWVELTSQKANDGSISISGGTVFASHKNLARLFVSYCVYLLDNNFPVPELPLYKIESDEHVCSTMGIPFDFPSVKKPSASQNSDDKFNESAIPAKRNSDSVVEDIRSCKSPPASSSVLNTVQIRALNLANLRVRAVSMLNVVSGSSLMDVSVLLNELRERIRELMEDDGGGVEDDEILQMLGMCEEFEVDPIGYVVETLNNLAIEWNERFDVEDR